LFYDHIGNQKKTLITTMDLGILLLHLVVILSIVNGYAVMFFFIQIQIKLKAI